MDADSLILPPKDLPDKIGLASERLERSLNRYALPNIGLHVIFVSTAILLSNSSLIVRILSYVLPVFALISFAATFRYFFPQKEIETRSFALAATISIILIWSLTIQNDFSKIILFFAAWLCMCLLLNFRHISFHAPIPAILYLPFLITPALNSLGSAISLFVFAAASLAMHLSSRSSPPILRQVNFGSSAIMALINVDNPTVWLAIASILFVIFFAAYEWRHKSQDSSDLLLFLNGAIPTAILYALSFSIFSHNSTYAYWLWGILTATYQFLARARPLESAAVRLAWIGLTAAVVAGNTLDKLISPYPFNNLSIHHNAIDIAICWYMFMVAKGYENLFTINIARIFSLFTLLYSSIYIGSYETLGFEEVFGFAVAFIAMTSANIIGAAIPYTHPHPFWVGIVNKRHMAAIHGFFLKTKEFVVKFPLIGILAKLFVASLGFLKYICGDDGRLNFSQITLAAASAMGAFIFFFLIRILLDYTPANFQGLKILTGADIPLTVACSFWGLYCYLRGKHNIMLRFAGLIYVLFPFIKGVIARDLDSWTKIAASVSITACALTLFRLFRPNEDAREERLPSHFP